VGIEELANIASLRIKEERLAPDFLSHTNDARAQLSTRFLGAMVLRC